MKTSRLSCGLVGVLGFQNVLAINLDVSSSDSIKQAAKTIATDMLTFYPGDKPGGTPGVLPQPPYYWWEAGAMMGTLIDYWYFTGDTSFNKLVTEALQFQVGPAANFMPPNQTKSLGNDDQAFWGLAVMSAAEEKFPNPPEDSPQWLALAQGVWNSQALRWDKSYCGGGLRWQIFTFNQGYDYKNAISNGCFFNLAARLGAYTGNATYFEWANRAWDWATTVKMVSPDYSIFDGSQIDGNCSVMNPIRWTYNAGVYMLGAATMWNVTTGAERGAWEVRLRGLIAATNIFFQNNIMLEVACETNMRCDTDQLSFKAYLARWMAGTMKVAPFTVPLLKTQLQASAQAAAKTCVGGTSGNMCSIRWTDGAFVGPAGVGQQMSALETIQSLLMDTVPGPLSQKSGGISKGNPNAGLLGDKKPGALGPITTGSRVAAGFATAALLASLAGGAWWMLY